MLYSTIVNPVNLARVNRMLELVDTPLLEEGWKVTSNGERIAIGGYTLALLDYSACIEHPGTMVSRIPSKEVVGLLSAILTSTEISDLRLLSELSGLVGRINGLCIDITRGKVRVDGDRIIFVLPQDDEIYRVNLKTGNVTLYHEGDDVWYSQRGGSVSVRARYLDKMRGILAMSGVVL